MFRYMFIQFALNKNIFKINKDFRIFIKCGEWRYLICIKRIKARIIKID